jgi:poly(A) polymerase
MAHGMTTKTLPAAAWTGREDLAALVAALDPDGAGTCRYVGGAVRDTLLGLAVKDIDMATQHRPEETQALLKAAGIRQVPTGLAHGTITAVLPGGPVEITTLRQDVSTDGRHATVAFSQDWREDAARRDFTINALYADPRTLALSDHFGGLDDLATRTVRFIGDAEQRIREDYLRILRYFRFQARFGSLPADAQAEAACAALAPGMKGLSRERIASELLGLLGLPDPAPTVARMAELGVLAQVLPEADPAPLPALIAAEAREGWRPTHCAAWPRCCPPIRPWPSRSPPACASRWRSASALPAQPGATRSTRSSPRARWPMNWGARKRSTGSCWPGAALPTFLAGPRRACRSRAVRSWHAASAPVQTSPASCVRLKPAGSPKASPTKPA